MGKEIVSVKDRLRSAAKQYASEEKTENRWITHRGGTLMLGEEEVPGNALVCVVLDAVHENTYYDHKFDPDNPVPPNCYALGRTESDMAPDDMPDHEWFEPQADTCAECPMSVFGSSDTGKGKACKERRRLAVMPAGMMEKSGRRAFEPAIFEDIQDYEDAEVAMLKLPPTSIRAWGKYVNSLARSHDMPPFGVITLIELVPDPKVQYRFEFQMLERLTELSDDHIELALDRNEQIEDMMLEGYDAPDDEDMEKPTNKASRGLSDLRKSRER